jgi:3-methyladenine DNA glycosylase AlkC
VNLAAPYRPQRTEVRERGAYDRAATLEADREVSMPSLKHNVDTAMLHAVAEELTQAWDEFPASRFVVEADDGLQDLELTDRIRQVATALDHALPDDAAEVVAVLDAALRSPTFEGWMVWPVAELIGRLAPADPQTYLPFMARLTHRSSCEFAVRGCIEAHPQLTFGFLQSWVEHPDEHVRRLVSEGSRPRLPWGVRLRALQRDPTPTIALLDRLRDDPSEYVRRSVANHLGDIVKDHPDLAIATAQRWQAEGGAHVDEVVRHGLRTLIKAGDGAALRLVGYDVDAPIRLSHLAIDPPRLAIGGQATILVRLFADGDEPVPVVVDYLIHYLGVRGYRKPKAYRLAERVVEPSVACDLRRRQRFAHASIRRLEPGEQLIEVQVNGRVLGSCRIDLQA